MAVERAKDYIPDIISCFRCGKEYTQPIRPQGGGCRKKYCSTKCSQKQWYENNKDRADKAKKRYAAKKIPRKPPTKDQKNKWKLSNRLRKHGLSADHYNYMLDRQKERCLICDVKFSGRIKPCIDHDHKDGRVRGLLCSKCNSSLGFAEDNFERLYRMAAYLTYDWTKPLIYVAGALRNSVVTNVSKTLREVKDWDVFDDYMASSPEGDNQWQAYEQHRNRSYIEALSGRPARNVFAYDKSFLDLADAMVLVYPAGRSCHLEAGYLVGRDRKVFILLNEEPERFEVMPQFVNRISWDLNELIKILKKEVPKAPKR